ncbi:TonB-dependent receptor, partial [Leptolyngbya valderiana BDU 20041]
MRGSNLRRTALATSIAFALHAGAAVAQDEEQVEDQETETSEQDQREDPSISLQALTVTGYRGSIMRAMDRKREAVGVVDAITAEDMGKFPDQNLAESLQRITGVSIDRSNNEGSRITVRGFGPEFNLVTLNGRSMPTAGGRSFDFADLATTGISAVEIYKTSNADMPTGGIGSTVNILTPRPLDQPGFRATISGKAVHETSSRDADVGDLDEWTPEIAGLYSNTFADNRWGILLSGSYQRRDNREENAAVDNWGPNLQLNGGIINNNNLREDGTWWHPQNIGYGWGDISRERINGQAVLQFRPSDRLTMTLDYTYSEVEFEKDANSVGIWFECPNIDATVNERGTVTEVAQACGDFSTNVSRDHTIKENDSIGFNAEWAVTDALEFSFDAHSSSSNLRGAGINGEPGSSVNLIIGNTSCDWCGDVPGAGPFTATINEQRGFFPGGGIPTFNVDFRSTGPNGGPQDGLLPQDIGSLFGQAFDLDIQNDIDQFQLGGSWLNQQAGALATIDFGVARTEQEFDQRNAYSGLLPAGFWLTSAQFWPDDAWDQGSYDGLLDSFANGGSFSYSDYYTAPLEYLIDQWETIGADNFPCCYWPDAGFWGPDFQDPSGTRGRFWSGPLGNAGESLVEETINSFYTQLTFEDMFNGMPWNAVIGIRYEDTETVSFGREVPATDIVWVGGNEFSYEFAEESSLRRGEGSNEFWLPNINFSIEIMPDVIGRFAYSRTIARPPIGALGPNRSFVGNPNVRNRRVDTGNPDLLPYVSDNFDLGLEWYYAPGSYMAANYFRKRVDNFLVSRTEEQTFDGILDPYIGALAEQARAQLTEEGINPTDQEVFRRINEILGNDPTTPVRAQPGDPLAVFQVTSTANEEVGNVWGYELAVQHLFGDSGFGVQANATFVRGDVEADRDVINQSFALPGLSDSANLILFYENEKFSGRVAYNWRDEFLSGFDQYGAPVYVESFAPIDLNLTYKVNEN